MIAQYTFTVVKHLSAWKKETYSKSVVKTYGSFKGSSMGQTPSLLTEKEERIIFLSRASSIFLKVWRFDDYC